MGFPTRPCGRSATWPTRDRDFVAGDWDIYRKVNRKFADAVLEEVGEGPAVVFVQDYHFALLPRMLKQERGDLTVVQFWHIPWPNREVFRVCPWQDEILDGLLGNDLLAFHIQHHCNNFLETVDRALEAKVDMERFAVTRDGHATCIRPHPISIDPELLDSPSPGEDEISEAQIRKHIGIKDEKILLGVDRVDYTKGIPERFAAADRLFERHPDLKGEFTFVQIGAPSRVHIATYRRLNEELDAQVESINWRHGQNGWRPIIFLNAHHGPEYIHPLYRMAAACVVSSLHDGMNLVAKEFVAARGDEQGVLVLSRFTGAARELDGAVLVNPYAVDEFAEALHLALTMPMDEQARRMCRMRKHVQDNNVFRWAGMLLSEAGKLAGAEKSWRNLYDAEPDKRDRENCVGLPSGPALGAVLRLRRHLDADRRASAPSHARSSNAAIAWSIGATRRGPCRARQRTIAQ